MSILKLLCNSIQNPEVKMVQPKSYFKGFKHLKPIFQLDFSNFLTAKFHFFLINSFY